MAEIMNLKNASTASARWRQILQKLKGVAGVAGVENISPKASPSKTKASKASPSKGNISKDNAPKANAPKNNAFMDTAPMVSGLKRKMEDSAAPEAKRHREESMMGLKYDLLFDDDGFMKVSSFDEEEDNKDGKPVLEKEK